MLYDYKSITAVLQYSSKGKIDTANVQERLMLPFADSYEYQDERNKIFFTKLKKAINLFNNESIFDVSIEIYFYDSTYGDNKKFIRIDRDYKDKENGTYTLFCYSLDVPESDKKQ